MATPTREQLRAAYGATVPDLLAPGLAVLLVGINPSLYSGWSGRHFARPGNRLWRTLHDSGLTDRRLHPGEQHELLGYRIGVTNLVAEATARADELTPAQLRAGADRLEAVVRRHRPAYVAFLGVGAYRTALRRPRARVGRQQEPFADAAAWVLPNPSGLNAGYQQPALTTAYAELRAAAFTP